jgi:ACS family sodium-dependent inorganic phosphate cotransporter
MRFATLSTLTVVTALSMPPVKRRRSPRLRAVAAGGSSNNGGGGVAFATSAMLLVSAHRTLFSAAMPELQASLGFDSKTVGALQAAYLAGYGLTNGVGGAAADRVGGARVLALGLLVWSGLVALTPAAASLGVTALALCRFGFGVASGPALPASLAVVSAQPDADSRAKGIATVLCGFNVGSTAGLLSAAALLTLLGWRTLSVVAGSLGAVVALYALTTAEQVTKKPVKFVKSFPVQLAALTHVHNCINWSFFVMQAWLPTYFASELGLDMKASALFSALPFATMALGSLVSGSVSSSLLQRMAPFEVRKRMVALSSVVPACALLALSYVKSPSMALGLLVTALGAHSFSSAGLHAHVTDVAPQASGRILGFTNTVGVVVGIVANVATGRVLDATGSFKAVFALTAAIYLSEVVAFFGFVRDGPLVAEDS